MSINKSTAPTDFIGIGRPYHPAKDTMDDTQRTWLTVQGIMKAAKNSKVTRAELTADLKEIHNHGSFVGYALNRGWLVKVK